jgi:hypothetical protein
VVVLRAGGRGRARRTARPVKGGVWGAVGAISPDGKGRLRFAALSRAVFAATADRLLIVICAAVVVDREVADA